MSFNDFIDFEVRFIEFFYKYLDVFNDFTEKIVNYY